MDMNTDTMSLTDSSWLHHPAAMDDTAAPHRSPAGVGEGLGSFASRAVESLGSLATRAAESLARGLVTCVFATVGTVLGAITGGLIGLATETGVVRGTGVGGITGALVSMEVVESSLAIWRSDEPAIWSVVYVVGLGCPNSQRRIRRRLRVPCRTDSRFGLFLSVSQLDVIWSLLTGRLVREKVDPAVLNAVESQMSAVEAPVGHGDGADIFETGGTTGMPKAAIDALPVVRFAERGNVDASGELVACSVCLQEFEAGESARSLPVCRHTFHLPCIDGWLLRHASCPLCRRAV
ncbi:hypothetical protein HU200_033941 [Digitaria exilis]|uniref:RING-type domain-containing protein n=1 Tax=Digitaria exilis TaxID=1010633 RepID=A0A835BKY4_9POAL|nr:hypothetical protein HU200_033941 [Digitaria exilis]